MERRNTTIAEFEKQCEVNGVAARLHTALGTSPPPEPFPVYLVPFAPTSPGVGFLSDAGGPVCAYIDCRRFTGAAFADGVLTLLGWALLARVTQGHGLVADLARRLPGTDPYTRRLRAVLAKILVEITAGELVDSSGRTRRPGVDVLGTAWRYPRLFCAAARQWRPYLDGLLPRDTALDAMAREIGGWQPRWYVDEVDASSLAADFYLLEWLTAEGDDGARRELASWTPRLAQYLAAQLDLIIGMELCHYERAHGGGNDPMAAFLALVSEQRSEIAWVEGRAELGGSRALELAEAAFDGPGGEFGGQAWAPVAATLRRYVLREISPAVLIDQCFTMQHNNGPLFDKFFDTGRVLQVLDAQAAGELGFLAEHASPAVRRRWRAHDEAKLVQHDPRWLGSAALSPPSPYTQSQAGEQTAKDAMSLRTYRIHVLDTEPGTLGCGSREEEAGLRREEDTPPLADPVATRSRRQQRSKKTKLPLTRFESVRAILRTSAGELRLDLWPDTAPYTVDNFVRLARGQRPWKDPLTNLPGVGLFYEGTSFHRRVPGFVIQAGDRSGTGANGPGYRIPDEISKTLSFDRPFLVAMANFGPSSAGSQFFITLTPAPHLDGNYAQFGEITHEASRARALRIAEEPEPVRLESVTVFTTAPAPEPVQRPAFDATPPAASLTSGVCGTDGP